MTQPQQQQVPRAFSHPNENSEFFRVEASWKRHLSWMRDVLLASHDTAAAAQVDFATHLDTEHDHYANTKPHFPQYKLKTFHCLRCAPSHSDLDKQPFPRMLIYLLAVAQQQHSPNHPLQVVLEKIMEV